MFGVHLLASFTNRTFEIPGHVQNPFTGTPFLKRQYHVSDTTMSRGGMKQVQLSLNHVTIFRVFGGSLMNITLMNMIMCPNKSNRLSMATPTSHLNLMVVNFFAITSGTTPKQPW